MIRLYEGMTRRAKIIWGSLAGVVALGTVANYAFDNPIGAVLAVLRTGVLNKIPEKEYVATNEANLQALRTAMLLYHDAEEQFPMASGWMDAVKVSLRTNDLKDGEEMKKLRVPGAKEGEFGYGMNLTVSGRYKDDVKPETILIYQSKDRKWNAAGDPLKDGTGAGITLSGSIVKLGDQP
jgi:hypothetical protein